jgi:glycerophosphoryl diester phosphodiesterase
LSALLALFLAAQSPTAPVIVAHRGLAEGVPENTLAAFRQSISRGVAAIEVDVRVTQDGQLVILHDATLDRTTDCSGPVTGFTLARLKSCDAGWPTHQGERVPTLGEVVALAGRTPARLLLDIKPGTPLDQVIREIRALHAEAKVIIGLRRATDVASARAALPGVTILAFMPKAGDAQAFAEAGANIIRIWSDWVDADPAVVARTRALAVEVWIMVGRRLPASPAEWRDLHARMLAANPQGLITDRPELTSSP